MKPKKPKRDPEADAIAKANTLAVRRAIAAEAARQARLPPSKRPKPLYAGPDPNSAYRDPQPDYPGHPAPESAPPDVFVSSAAEWDDDVDTSPVPPSATPPVFSNEGLKRAVTHSMTDDQFSKMLNNAHRGDQGKNRGKFGDVATRLREMIKAGESVTVKKIRKLKLVDVGDMTDDAIDSAIRRARKSVAAGSD